MSNKRNTDFQDDFEPSSQLYFEEERENNNSALKPNLWQRLSRAMEVLIYVLCFLAVAKMFWPEIERQKQLNTELANLDKVLKEKQDAVNQLRQKHELLKNDREFLEVVSRDRLNLMRSDEYVIRIERGEVEE